jgi:DNA invertase Pin-like site-specific DNA recombinase
MRLHQLGAIARQVDAKQAHLAVLEQSFDTSTSTGRLLFGILAVIAQFETELRAERQREGIAAAQAKGVHFGRQKALTTDDVGHLRVLRKEGWTITRLQQRYRLGKTAIYRYLADEQGSEEALEAAD